MINTVLIRSMSEFVTLPLGQALRISESREPSEELTLPTEREANAAEVFNRVLLSA